MSYAGHSEQLPLKVVLSFSFFDFGCGGVYEKQNDNKTFELINASKPRRIVFQKDNVLGPSWVLLDPAHDIHYCLAVSEKTEFPLQGWQPVGIPKRFLPSIKWFDSSDLSLIERLRRLPASGIVRDEDGVFYLDLDPAWLDFLEDGFDYAFNSEHIRRASDRANVWADFIALRKRVIERFNPKDATVRLGEDLNIAEGDKVRFYCDCINEKLVEKVSDYNDEMRKYRKKESFIFGDQDLASLVLLVTLKFNKQSLPSTEMPITCFGLRKVPSGKCKNFFNKSVGVGSLAIHTSQASIQSFDGEPMSPMTVTSSDEERDFDDFLEPPQDDPDLDAEPGAIDFDDLSDEDSSGPGALGDAFGDLSGPPDDDDDDFLEAPDDDDDGDFLQAPDDDDDDDDDFLQAPPDAHENKKNAQRWYTDIVEIIDQKTENEQTYFKVAWKNETQGEWETWEKEEEARKYATLLVDQFTGVPSDSQQSCAALNWDMLAELGEGSEEEDEDEDGETEENDENAGSSEQDDDFEITYEDTAPVRTANGETVHEIKRKLRQIERVKKSMMRGKKVSTEQVKLMAKKNELEKLLEQAKIDSQFAGLRNAARQENHGLDTLTSAERNNLRAFAASHSSGGSTGSTPSRGRSRRRARRPPGGLETINELGSVSE